MTAKELREALVQTGTGEFFLRPIDELLRENRDATGEEAFEAMRMDPDKRINNPISKPIPTGQLKPFALHPTLDKARKLLNGTPVSALQGTPPRGTLDREMQQKLAEVALRLAERSEEGRAMAQAKNIGLPVKPEGAVTKPRP